MPTLPKIIADLELQLATQIDIGGTTATLQTNVDDDAVTLPDGLYYFTLDSGSSVKEHISCTKTGVNLTAIKTVSRQGVETSGVLRVHRVGASCIMTDFATYKSYMDTLAIQGALDSSTTVKGVSTLSVAPVSPTAPIAVGDNDPRLTADHSVAGLVSPYAGTTAPTGWLLCDGSAVSRTTYAALFGVTSTIYGSGDGSTTFNLPNLKNRIPIGLDASVKVVIDNCDAAWTAGSNVTATNDTSDKKEGTGSVKLDVGASATAGQILGYKALSSFSLAGKTTIGMWVKSSIALNAGDLQYKLDDTAAIASSLEAINIPALDAGVWTKIYLTLANPGIDVALISHGIYQVNNKGAFQFWIDDINDGENYEVGATGGEKTHVLSKAEMPSHTHRFVTTDVGGSGTSTIASNSTQDPFSAKDIPIPPEATGGGLTHNNLQPYITLNYIIKY